MPRPREMIELMERVLDREVTERLAIEQAAAQCAEMSRDIRVRLGQAVEYSRKGLRMEVRSIADARPPLVETADLLTSPIVGKWREFCIANEIAVPARISVAMIEELQCALCAFDVNGLVKLHALFRKQNLGLAAAYPRLQTLRRIALLDENSAAWAADIKSFEVQAIYELRKDFAAAIDASQLGDAAAIVETLQRADWKSSDSHLIAASLYKQLLAAYAKHAVIEAVRVSDQMHANYMAESIERVRQNLDEWQLLVEQMQQGGVELPNEALEIVTPIAEWVAQRSSEEHVERETKACRAELQRAVMGSVISVHEIESLLMEVEAMPGGVPEDLRRRAEERIRALVTRIKLRRAAQFVGVGLIVVAVISAAIWFVRDQIRTDEQARFSEQVTAAVDRGDDAEVQRLLAESKNGTDAFYESPSVLESLSRHEKTRQELEARDARFESLMASAGNPSTASAGSEAIAFASDMARTEAQRNKVADWREAQAAATIQAQTARDQGFLQEVRKLAFKIDAVEALHLDRSETQTLLTQVEVLTDQLRLTDGVGHDARAAFDIQGLRLKSLRVLVNAEQTRMRSDADEANALATVLRSVGDAARLQTALLDFATAHPDSTYERDFRLVAGQADWWRPVIEWAGIALNASRNPLPSQIDHRATQRAVVEDFLRLYSNSVVAPSAKKYLALLQTDTSWCEWLSKILLEPPMDFNMIEMATGERYYYKVNDIPQSAPDGQRRVRAVVNWNKELFQVIPLDSKQIKYEGPSPQAKLADKLLPLVRGASAKRTGEGALEVARIICDDQSVDPVMSALLMQQLLPKMQLALANLAPDFQRAIDLLAEENLDDFTCFAPGNPTKRRDFARIRKLVSDLQVADWMSNQKNQTAEVVKSLRAPLRPIGLIDHASPDGWRASDTAGIAAGEKLFVIVAVGASGCRLEEIGAYTPQGARLIQPLVKDSPSGTPVFSSVTGVMK